ncbi:MAG: MscL family protein [Rhodobacteraceae bacterium]|nr:MscL family protein [Paracoccaceae bacterium]
MPKEFRGIISKGNVMDMAVDIIIGAALTRSNSRRVIG